MQQIKGLYQVSRPLTTLTGALAVVLGGYVAGTGEWFYVGLAVLAQDFNKNHLLKYVCAPDDAAGVVCGRSVLPVQLGCEEIDSCP